MLRKLTMWVRWGRLTVILVAMALVLFPASQSPAAPGDEIAQANVDCSNPRGTPEINFCAQKSYEAADKRLNEVYQKVVSGLSADQKDKLVDIQQTWIKFRDASCDFETYQARNGTGYIAYLSECKERLTKQRTADLEKYLSFRAGATAPPTLKLGSKGEEVKELQRLLGEPKLSLKPVKIDGVFGQTTEAAVKEFQRKAYLPADGIVGPTTWEKLYDVLSF